MEFTLHQRLHRKQNRTIDVVEQVQRREQNERSPGIKFRLGHLAKEYITTQERIKNQEKKKIFSQRSLRLFSATSAISS